MNIKQLDKTYIANTYGRFDLVVESGKGALVTDADGKQYIDLGAGIAVNTFGIADPSWQQAVTAQLGKLQHLSNLYYTQPQVTLAQMLCEKTGMNKVFFSNSGAEANECAIKAARKYSFDRYGKGRSTIITLKNSFHGRTVTTLSATGQDAMHTFFDPFTEGFVYQPANDWPAMQQAMEQPDVCAVMIELIQGEGGVNVLEPDYVKKIAALAKAKDILLLVDEVQTGNGRTGKLYCFMHYGVEPDIFSTAKGLAGGLPLGATLFNQKTEGVLSAGTHGSTFGGNPICAAGAVNVLSRLDDALMEQVSQKGNWIKQQLEGAKGIESVCGLGLMIGVKTEKPVLDVVKACMERGVILLTAKDKVRLLPPLNITQEQLEQAVSILKQAAAE